MYHIISIYLNVEDYATENKMHTDTEDKQEKMAAAPILISSRYGRRELGLTNRQHIICCTVYLQKMMPCMTDAFFVNGKFTEHFHSFSAGLDLLTSFVCSLSIKL